MSARPAKEIFWGVFLGSVGLLSIIGLNIALAVFMRNHFANWIAASVILILICAQFAALVVLIEGT